MYIMRWRIICFTVCKNCYAAYYLFYLCENWHIMCFAFFEFQFFLSFAKYSNITIILFDRYFCVVQYNEIN